jgi:hypothetical protein
MSMKELLGSYFPSTAYANYQVRFFQTITIYQLWLIQCMNEVLLEESFDICHFPLVGI